MNRIKKTVSLILSAALLTGILTVAPAGKASADDHFIHNESVTVDGVGEYTVHALDEGYDNNVYLSLRDMSTVLSNTRGAFSVDVSDSGISMILGENGDTERAMTGWSEDEEAAYYGKSLAVNDLTIDGNDRKYYTIRASYQGGSDCFMSLASLAMILDVNMYENGDNALVVSPDSSLVINPKEYEEDGFFLELNSALVGDATTGQIYYEYNGDTEYPIASTTKLMTALLTEEAIENGSITMDTMVTLSEEAARISRSADGEIQMTAGNQAPVSELLTGALLPSSNECALALAEAIGGDEETFVGMMNDKAAELSMGTAVFYNSNGLPSYGVDGMPGKRQNHMSAEDMYKMCAYLVETYPQIKEITSKTDASLPDLGRDVKNTNALLYNMPEVDGLKTGTTDKAGACLITSLTVNDGSMDHDLIVVVLGAEGSKARFTISELLARYGKKVVTGEESADGVILASSGDGTGEGEEVKPVLSADSLVNLVVNGALKLKKEEEQGGNTEQ